MSNKCWVLDTNILVYLLNAESSQHNATKNVIKQAQKENISLVTNNPKDFNQIKQLKILPLSGF